MREILFVRSRTLIAFILMLVGAMGVQAQTVGLKKARVAIPNTAIGPIPTFVAKELGYYRDEGFDTEIILMRGGVTIQALISGSVDYTGTPGSTVAAAVQGAKLLVLMAYFDKPLYDLLVRPEISSYSDLKGKRFAVGSLSGFSFEIPRAMLNRNGLEFRRDVATLMIGPTADRLLALKANAVQATLLDPPYNFLAVQEGLRKLDSSMSYFQSLFGALTTSEQKIRSEPDDVRRFIRATARGFLVYKNRREVSIPIMQRVLKMDRQLAGRTYDYSRAAMTTDGTITDDLMRTVIETQRQSSGVSRAITADEVFNFNFVHLAMEELATR